MKPGISGCRLCFVGGDDVRFRIPLLSTLRDMGFRVAAIGSDDSRHFASADIDYYRYGLKQKFSPQNDLRTVRLLRHWFSSHPPDIVNSFTTKPNYVVPLAIAPDMRIPVVRTITGMGRIYSSNSPANRVLKLPYSILQRLANRRSAYTVFQNTADQRQFESEGLVSAEKSILIRGSGLDFRQLGPDAVSPADRARFTNVMGLTGKRVVTMVSRVIRSKGVPEFIEAATRIRASNDDVRFLLVGPADSFGRDAISREELSRHADVVNYLGPRSDVPVILASSTIFVLPTRYREGVPRVLLEACAMQLPIVTTDMPGCRDIVGAGQNGLTVEPGDIAGLAAAIEELLVMPDDDLSEMGRASAGILQYYTLDRVADSYADLYSRILSARRDH